MLSRVRNWAIYRRWRERRRLSVRQIQRQVDKFPDTDVGRQILASTAAFRREVEALGKQVEHLSDAQIHAGILQEASRLRAGTHSYDIDSLIAEAHRRWVKSLPDRLA